jgi:hypothetical protein
MDETKKQQLIDALRGGGAAFGVYPQMQPHRAHQDPEASKNVPIDLARGFASGVIGMPGDMLSGLGASGFLPTSDQVLSNLPFGSESPVGNAASILGQQGGQLYNGPGSVFGPLLSKMKAANK